MMLTPLLCSLPLFAIHAGPPPGYQNTLPGKAQVTTLRSSEPLWSPGARLIDEFKQALKASAAAVTAMITRREALDRRSVPRSLR